MEANTLAMKAYNSLDVVNRTAAVEVEVDQLERPHDPDAFSQRFISASFDMKLVEAAYIAGRWGEDPVIASQCSAPGLVEAR